MQDTLATHRKCAAELRVELVSGQSSAVSIQAQNPLKILVPHPRGPSVWAYLSNYGGGLLGGDQISVSVDIGPGAVCFLGTQASTKIYRNRADRPSSQSLSARVAAGATLVLAPDPIQPFAHSSYRQSQHFHVQPGGSLVLVDWLTSGRAARGERWALDCFHSHNELYYGPDRVVLDSLLLDSSLGPLHGAFRLGRFNCLAVLAVLGAPLTSAAGRILEAVGKQSVPHRGELLSAASPISHGVLLRVAGESVEKVRREIHRYLDFVPALLHDDPWLRKW